MTENLGQNGDVRGTETGTSGEQSAFGQEAAVQVAQAEPSQVAPVQVAPVQVAQAGNVVAQPAAGEQIVVQAAAGQRYVVEFDTDAAEVSVQGNDLILRFPDGATITFAGLGQFSGDPNAPVFEVAGQPVAGDVIFAQAAALAAGEEAPSFETAAGQGEAVGTGETRYDDDTGQLIDLIDPQGVIPPTELAFRLIDLEPSEVLLPVGVPVTTPEDVPVIVRADPTRLDEDDLPGGIFGDNVAFRAAFSSIFGDNFQFPGTDVVDGLPVDPIVAQGTIAVNFGFDRPGTLTFGPGAEAALEALNLTSSTFKNGAFPEGIPLSYARLPDNTAIVGFVDLDGDGEPSADDEPVFAVLLSPAVSDGDFSYLVGLFGSINHPLTDDPGTPDVESAFEDPFSILLPFTATDFDGDSATGTLQFTLVDDIPVIEFASFDDYESQFSDGMLPGESTGELKTWESDVPLWDAAVSTDVTVTFGADGPENDFDPQTEERAASVVLTLTGIRALPASEEPGDGTPLNDGNISYFLNGNTPIGVPVATTLMSGGQTVFVERIGETKWVGFIPLGELMYGEPYVSVETIPVFNATLWPLGPVNAEGKQDWRLDFQLVRQIDHPDNDNPATPDINESEYTTSDGTLVGALDNIRFEFNVTAIDDDGDAVSIPITVDVDDDGPTILDDESGIALVHDESPGEQNGVPATLTEDNDDDDLPVDPDLLDQVDEAQAAVDARLGAGILTLTAIGGVQDSLAEGVNFDPGADGLKEVSFDVSAGGIETGDDTGLLRSTDNATVTYVVAAPGLILGVTGFVSEEDFGDVVFSLHLETTNTAPGAGEAEFTFVQYQAVEHFLAGDGTVPPGSHDEGLPFVVDEVDGRLSINYVVEDNDGDTAVASGDDAILVDIEDDGPSIATQSQNLTMINDETVGVDADSDDVDFDGTATPGDTSDDATIPDPVTDLGIGEPVLNASKKLVDFKYGADGKGDTGGIALDDVVNGTDSGLVDTATGRGIFLFNGTDDTVVGLVVPEEVDPVVWAATIDLIGDPDSIDGLDVAFVSVLEETGTPNGAPNGNESTADLWFVQYRAIEHDNPFDPDEAGPEGGPGGSGVPGSEVITFEGLAAGTFAGSFADNTFRVFSEGGTIPITITGRNPNLSGDPNAAVIFDSGNPTGNDDDLRTPGTGAGNDTALGNILIVDERASDGDGDGLVDDPNDVSAVGSTLSFDFSGYGSVAVESITVLDIEANEKPPRVELFDVNDNKIATFLMPIVGDNGVGVASLGDVDGVVRMDVILNGSGAIDNIEFRPEGRFFDEFLNLNYTVTDADGDTAAGAARIALEDDGPTAVDDPARYLIGGVSIGGNVVLGNDLTSDTNDPGEDDLGADGGTFSPDGPLHTFTFIGDDGFGNAIELTAAQGTTVTTFAGGTLTVNGDGTWAYEAPVSVDAATLIELGLDAGADAFVDDFSYDIHDGDGDVDHAIQPIRVLLNDSAIFGDATDRTLTGTADSDTIVGGTGNERIEGLDGGDLLFGNGGNDTLIGGLGNDLMYGDDGADRFSFASLTNEGSDKIGDFSVAEGDTLEFTDVVDPADAVVEASFNKVGDTVTVDLTGGTSLTIVDVDNAINTVDDLLNNSVLV